MLQHQEEFTHLQMDQHQKTLPYLSAASFWLPAFIPLSAWIQHAPFAFWLVNATHPENVVELGVHYGYSYFAFCQAVQQLKLSARCYGVDTWMGDEHSGFYGEEVFHKVNTHNEQKYSGFSHLIRATFDNALKHFQDKSIDILHIDGRHFYQDVKHDFETWRPKLSDRGIVLFHDTCVKEKNFGVFTLWEELRQLYPHFEFVHGHGLGVLGVGKLIPAKLRLLFDAADNDDEVAAIRSIYYRLGLSLDDHYQLTTERQRMMRLLTEEEKLRAELATLKDELTQRDLNIATLTAEKQHLQKEMMNVKNQLSLTETVLREREQTIKQLGLVVMKMRSSLTWRLALPLRKLKQVFYSFCKSRFGQY